MKYLILTLVTLGALLIGVRNVHADPNYTYGYNATNFYTTNSLVYEFSGLDAGQSYLWYIYTVDIETGLKDKLLSFRTLGPGVTVGSWNLDFLDDLPADYSGPLYVIDRFDNVLGKHFVVPSPHLIEPPWNNNGTGAWFCAAVGCGATPMNDKQVMSRFNNSTESGVDIDPTCLYPIYKPFNSEGWHHYYDGTCGIITRAGEFGLLHFIIDPTDYPLGNDESIVFYDTPTTTSVLSVTLDQIVDYQVHDNYSGGATYVGLESFLIVNTSGSVLPFIDRDRAELSFGAVNPMNATFAPGVYNQRRESVATGFVSDSESVWMVSNDPLGLEWTVDVLNEPVGEGGTQQLVTTAVTPEIWNDYFEQAVYDSLYGTISLFNFQFTTRNTFNYVVGAPIENAAGIWDRQPINAFLGEATDVERSFLMTDLYDIVEVKTFEEIFNQAVDDWGLATELGRNALMFALIFFGLAAVALSPLRNLMFVYVLTWTAIGGIYVIAGFSTSLGSTIFILSTVMLWVLSITSDYVFGEVN